MKHVLTLALAFAASPALAAGDKFFSLSNTDFIVCIAFILFLGILAYFKVPAMLSKMLDQRAETIRAELDEAKALREEAQTLLAGYERKAREVNEQAERIVKHAREEALLAAEDAKASLAQSLERRLKAADEQIASAEAAAVREVRDQAIKVAVEAASDAISKNMAADDANGLIEASIKEVETKLH